MKPTEQDLSFNIDVETGIRYGVIQANLVKFWREESEPLYEVELVDEVNDIYPENPSIRILEAIGYQAQQDEFGDIVLSKSPYFTYGKFVGNHMPGAVHMSVPNSTADDPKCYCFGPEFYDRYKIPHDIYDVATGELIHKNKWVKTN